MRRSLNAALAGAGTGAKPALLVIAAPPFAFWEVQQRIHGVLAWVCV